MKTVTVSFILFVLLVGSTTAKVVPKVGEIEVRLQFLEYELEDFCIAKSNAEWSFLNGSEGDLKKFLDVEIKESELYKHELEVLQKHTGKKFSNEKLQRLMDVFSHPGAYLLDGAEFKEYRDYTLKLQEITETMKIEPEGTSNGNETSNSISSDEKDNSVNRKKVNKILYNEKNEQKVREIWIRWYETLEERNKKTKYDFLQQLSILDLEAEQNGEEELTEYWLKQSDTTWVNYETVKNLWEKISPLYDKLKQFLKSLVVKNFGKNVLYDQETIPAHVLGSLETHEWLTAAEKLNAFENFDCYKIMESALREKTPLDLYKMADNLTAELKIGHLPQTFYEKSNFNESSQTCENKIMEYCERENVLRAMFCKKEAINLNQYISVNENVMKMKHQILCGMEEEENGFLFREGPRDSALYEAMETLSSVRALWPEKLQEQGLLTNQTQQQKNTYSLLVTALHVIPKLPYYLASDMWRINALREIDASIGENTESTSQSPISTTHSVEKRDSEKVKTKSSESEHQKDSQGAHNVLQSETETAKTYDTQSLTKDWWTFRLQYQGIGSPEGKFYEDYLQDKKIIWNKPYLSKFLGKLLLFQILEKTENFTRDIYKIQALLRKGKSKPWESLIEDSFNITEISSEPLLRYFKPLEDILDKGLKVKNHNQIFSLDDFNFISQGFSLDPTNNAEGEEPAEGSDALFFSLAVIAAVGVVAVIVTIGRRRYKKRQRMRERKRRLAEL